MPTLATLVDHDAVVRHLRPHRGASVASLPMAKAKSGKTVRLSLGSLGALLDLPGDVTVTAATGEGDMLVLTVDGVDVEGDEVVADYTVGGRDGRRFNMFKSLTADEAEQTATTEEA